MSSTNEEKMKSVSKTGKPRKVDDDDDDDECAPHAGEEKDMLFLIEFLVDTMILKPENMDLENMDPCLLQGQTCLVMNFLHYPPMAICEADIDPCRQTGGNFIRFNAGKSLMFALSESEFENPRQIFLNVFAYKMLPHGSVPNKLPIGMAKICLVELFKQVFNKVDQKPDKLPVSKSIKDHYTLMGLTKKCPTAEVTIYMRLSCLGQNVVTEFQRGNDECDPFFFKSKESKKVYQCKPKDMPLGDEAEDLCPPVPGWGEISGRDCGDGQAKQPESCCRNDVYAGNGAINDPDDEAEFDEFGTEVHGHALTIKVQKSQRKQIASSEFAGTGKSESPMKGREPGNQISFQVPQSQNLCKKGKSENKAQVYRVNAPGTGGCGSMEPLQVIQGVDSPDKDIFVLRIGKKGETYAKGKLELELRTPKTKIERPINLPRKTDRAVQTEKEDTPKKGRKKKK